MTKDKGRGIGVLALVAVALWFAFGRRSAEEAELSQIETQLPTATGDEKIALLARKAELEAILAARALAEVKAQAITEEKARLNAEVAALEAGGAPSVQAVPAAMAAAKEGIPPSVSVPGLFEARVDQLYQEKIAGIPTSWGGVSSELEQLFYQDDLATAKLQAVIEAERELSGDIHIVYESTAVAKAVAENQFVDYQRMYQEGLDALAGQGLLGKYYEGAGSGGWFDKLRNLETVIPEQEARVASPLTVREEQALEAGAATQAEALAQAEAESKAALEAEVAALEAKVTASEVVKTVEEQNTVPEAFSASKDQLDELASSVSKDSSTYQKAIDYSYAKTASTTKSGDCVAWSSSKGYHTVSKSEVSSWGM